MSKTRARIFLILIASVVLFFFAFCSGSIKKSTNQDLPTHLINVSAVEEPANAVFFGDYFFVSDRFSYDVRRVFYNRDEQGNYLSWKEIEDFLPDIGRVSELFKYNGQLFCVSSNKALGWELMVYNQDFTVSKRKVMDKVRIYPQYIYDNWLYSYAWQENSDRESIIRINLEDLSEQTIYSYKIMEAVCFEMNEMGEIIIYKMDSDQKTTQYYTIRENTLIPVFKTGDSMAVGYNKNGLFYLEESSESEDVWDLKCWDGTVQREVSKVKTDDRHSVFAGLDIQGDYIVTFHRNTEEPYVLVESIDGKVKKKVMMQKWEFTDADMDRFGETFSGLLYDHEEGNYVEFFYSKHKGMLQTKVIDLGV